MLVGLKPCLNIPQVVEDFAADTDEFWAVAIHAVALPRLAAATEDLLDVIWHSSIEVLISVFSAGSTRHPAQLLAYLPHMCVHRKLCSAHAEHQHTGHGLGPHALKLCELCFDLITRKGPQVLKAQSPTLCQ